MKLYPILGPLLFLAAASALPQQFVKGGHEGQGPGTAHNLQYNHTAVLNRFYNNGTSVVSKNGTQFQAIDFNVGVCYEEVPTASLVKDPTNIPPGNGTKPGYSNIRTCCKGYTKNAHNFRRCDPVCTLPCINGVCTAPDTCTCNSEHVKNKGGFCVPICPKECQNGQCAGGECICNPGYTVDKDSKYCTPLCKDDCGGHGNCTAPEKCDCFRGYGNLLNDGACHPVCDGCDNGKCVAPGDCKCNQGFSKNLHGECVPVCSKGCSKGVCIAPDVCACAYGFQLNEATGGCEARCLRPCLNGVCSGPDTCSCNTGYVLDNTDPTGSRCLPNCPGGCTNGVCSAPNLCLCNFGFVKDRSIKGRQVCVPRVTRVRRQPDVNDRITFAIPPQYNEDVDELIL